tara:strand:+ start:764 stop:3550 length:2787 start_codon:yes stop_codon:yes gene_type:complete
MKIKYLLLAFTFLIPLLSQQISADERAPKGKCYLGIGFVNGKSQVEDFAKKSGYNPVKFEIFERKDKKLYFTFGKIDEKLFKRNKSDGYLDEKFFCASGKGYLRRFNLTSEYKLIKGSKRFLDYQVDLQAALEPINTSKNTEDLANKKNETNVVQEATQENPQPPVVNSNYGINFGSSSSGIILNKQAEAFTIFKTYLDNKIQSTQAFNNVTKFKNINTTSSYNYASFSFGIFRNLKYQGYIKDLNGNLVLNPTMKPGVIALKLDNLSPASLSRSDSGDDNEEAKIFMNTMKQFELFPPMLDYAYIWGLKELKEISTSSNVTKIKFKYDPFLVQKLQNYDSFNYGARNYSGYGEPYNWDDCFRRLNIENVLYIFAPLSCMQYYNNTTKKIEFYSTITHDRQIGEFELLKEINILTLWDDPMDKEISNLNRMAKEYKINSKQPYVAFNINSSKTKICIVSQGDDDLNNLIKLHADKTVDKNNPTKVFNNLNDLYLEISAIKQEDCGNLIMTLDELAKLSGPIEDIKYSLANLEVINNFFTNDDLENSFMNLYAGLSTDEVEAIESVTSMEITPKNARYFKELENQFKENEILFSKNNFDIYKKTTNLIYGNTYLSNIISVLKYSGEISAKNIDVNSSLTMNSISNNFDNKIDLENADRLKIYHNLITNLNLNIDEIDQLFISLNLIQVNNLNSDKTFKELFRYYIRLISSSKETENPSNIDVKALINNNIMPDGLKINEYIVKLAKTKKQEAILAAQKAKEAEEKAKAEAELKAQEAGYASAKEYETALNEAEKQKQFEQDVQKAIKVGRNAKKQFSTEVYNAACKRNANICADNSDIINVHKGGAYFPPGCKRLAEQGAKYGDIDWGGWFDINFSKFRTGDSYHTKGTITFIDEVGKYQNGFGAMVKTRTYCEVDMVGGRGALRVWID